MRAWRASVLRDVADADNRDPIAEVLTVEDAERWRSQLDAGTYR